MTLTTGAREVGSAGMGRGTPPYIILESASAATVSLNAIKMGGAGGKEYGRKLDQLKYILSMGQWWVAQHPAVAANEAWAGVRRRRD